MKYWCSKGIVENDFGNLEMVEAEHFALFS